MPRSIRSPLETRSARVRLPQSKHPTWQALERGLAVGYHKPLGGGAGAWWGRKRAGGKYVVKSLATADDYFDANGIQILNWGQAQVAVHRWATAEQAGQLTVAQAVRDYVADLRARKGDKAAQDVEGRLRLHLLPKLGDRQAAELTTADLTNWRNSLVTGADEESIRRSRDTANRLLNMAKAVLNLAFNNGLIPDDRAWRRVKRFRGVGAARMVLLSDADLQALVDPRARRSA
jgi:hypothetical protein